MQLPAPPGRIAAVVVLTAAVLSSAPGASAHPATSPASGTATSLDSGSPPGTARTAGTTSPAPSTSATGRRTSTVTLVTGDRVSITRGSDGNDAAHLVLPDQRHPGSGASGFQRLSWHGDQYVIPVTAMPYLATGVLGLQMFDVSYLARTHLADQDASSIPVTVTYRTAGTHPDLPGVDVRQAKGGQAADARIGKGTATAFGRALAAHARQRGKAQPGRDPLSGVASIRLAETAGAASAPAATSLTAPAPHGHTPDHALPQETLRIRVTDRGGNPGLAMLHVQNVDDFRLFDVIYVVQGGQSFSVPKGTYSVEASIVTVEEDGTNNQSLVAVPQLEVTGDRTVTLDARTANPLTTGFDTDVRAWTFAQKLNWTRRDASTTAVEPSLFSELIAIPALAQAGYATQLFAAPTEPVTVGSFHVAAAAMLSAGDPPANILDPSWQAAPFYALDFPNATRVPDSLHYTVKVGDLVSLTTSDHDESTATATPCGRRFGVIITHPVEPVPNFGFSFDVPVPGPERTDFVYSSDPDASWYELEQAPDCIRRLGALHAFEPGQRVAETFGQQPWAPIAVAPYDPADTRTPLFLSGLFGVTGDYPCPACLQDGWADLYLSPSGDSDPRHVAITNLQDDSMLRLYRNGTLVRSMVGPTGVALPVAPDDARYQLEWTLTRPTDQVNPFEPRQATTWTFGSAPASAEDSMPPAERCLPDTSRPCAFLPLLFVRYDLPLDVHSSAAAGSPMAVRFTVSRQPNEDPPTGLSAQVWVSYDDGATWTAAPEPTPGHDGAFTTTVTHPELDQTSGFVSLRVRATDAAGNSVDQTIIRAYRLAAS